MLQRQQQQEQEKEKEKEQEKEQEQEQEQREILGKKHDDSGSLVLMRATVVEVLVG
jgi:hypothetical protein